MKKSLKWLAITASIFTLISCNTSKPSIVSPSMEDSVSIESIPESEPSLPEISNSEEISESLSISEEKKESKWGKAYTDLIIGTLGEDIPYIDCSSFQITKSKDDYGDDMIVFFVYFNGVNLNEKLEEYNMIAKMSGYTTEFVTQRGYNESGYYEYEVYYADKVISETIGIEMQFLLGGSPECLGIFAYNYSVDSPTAWPTNLVKSLLGYDVPHLKDDGSYIYNAHINTGGPNGNNYIDMIISNVPSTAEDDYAKILEDAGYSVTDAQYDSSTGEYEGRYAFPADYSHAIQFGLSSYGLEIYIYKL